LSSYTQYTGSVGNGALEGLNLSDFFSSLNPASEISSGEDSVNIDRPFKMFFWVNWRPFKESPVFTITPLIGFSIDQLYIEPFSMEGGLSACLNIRNIFLVRLGINYMDRMWINSLNLAFNLRLFEIDIGVDIRSQDFLKSWEGGGLGLNVGLKFGW
jgi:hypothetical protein